MKYREKNKITVKLDNSWFKKSNIIKVIYIHGYFIMCYCIIHIHTSNTYENKQKKAAALYIEISHVWRGIKTTSKWINKKYIKIKKEISLPI